MDVLVVDDDAELRAVVRRTLEREGVGVREAGTGAEARSAVAAVTPSVVVLDLDLPDVQGLDLLGELRARDPEIRVLVLTGAGRESERVLGLVSGADDYVVKPFSPRELAARVLALTRRGPAAAPSSIVAGPLTIDLHAREVRRGGEPVELPKRELDLLAHLASNPGRAYSREELLRAVWGASTEWLGVATVTEHIRRLRVRVERDPSHPELIVTVRGGGYRFDVPTPRSGSPEVLVGAAVWIIGTKVVHSTPDATALLGGTTPEEIVGHDLFDFVAPESEAATRARHERAATGEWPRPERLVLRRLDGAEVTCDVSSSPVLFGGTPASRVQLWPVEEPEGSAGG